MDLVSLSPAGVRALLERHDVRPSRALGQNFLADANTARRIVRLAGVGPGDRVLEIGPGVGSLTVELARAGARVLALELDRYLLPVLEDVVRDAGDVRVVPGDAMTVDLDGLLADATDHDDVERGDVDRDERWHLVSNLPYNVATPLVMRVLDDVPRVVHLLVMMQREVGERLAAGVGDAAYGAVSVKVAYYATAKVVAVVPPTVFVPRPNVDSVLVEITRRDAPAVDVPDPQRLFALVRAGFAQRRKMLRGALRTTLGPEAAAVLEEAGIDPARRAESLTLTEWAALAHVSAPRP
jgi:16S rRNA (adenine1518-N6/adenine1519-N6)-dimethyltransferase